MANSIGFAGWEQGAGRGRIGAFTKAISFQDLNNDLIFQRLFLNSIHWCHRKNKINAIILNTEDSVFNTKLSELISSAGYNPVFVNPWYTYTGSLANSDTAFFILFPSYNPFGGLRMPDSGQNAILQTVNNFGAGLLLCEWFHYLHSLPSKRSFKFSTSDGGLHTLSPLKFTNEIITYSYPDSITFSKNILQDSLSYTIPEEFTIITEGFEVGYEGVISQISEVKDGAEIFYFTDVFAKGTTTTTTTTTIKPEQNIKFKVAEIDLIDYCGPHTVSIKGPSKDFFILEGKDLFLTEDTGTTGIYDITVSVEDFFRPKRFSDYEQDYRLELIKCDPPLSKPLDGSGPAFSWRENYTDTWGAAAPYGIIRPFNDYSFLGEGTPEDPVVAWLGGQHGDSNALWIQINKSGRLSYALRASSENDDIGSLWIVSGIAPYQHEQSYYDEFYFQDPFGPMIPGDTSNLLQLSGSEAFPPIGQTFAERDVDISKQHFANFNQCAEWNNQEGNVTSVGTNGGPSYYGTYDQAGNVAEWTEGIALNQRVVRGGSWNTTEISTLSALSRILSNPSVISSEIGFRVASSGNPYLFNDFVTVGNLGNASDSTSYGSVLYEYSIGKYEVTNNEYVQFLNYVAASSDINSVYVSSMTDNSRGGIIRNGQQGSYSYSSKTNMGNKPVNFVNWYSAIRYINWLHNNKPSGIQSLLTTENGSYDLSEGVANPTRKNNAKYFLPSENEWYKAAYYKGGNISAGYWDFPTQSDQAPRCLSSKINGEGSDVKTFIVLTFYKDRKLSRDDDKINLIAFIGTTTTTTTTTSTTTTTTTTTPPPITTPPPLYTYTINIIDNITNGYPSTSQVNITVPVFTHVPCNYGGTYGFDIISDSPDLFFVDVPTVYIVGTSPESNIDPPLRVFPVYSWWYGSGSYFINRFCFQLDSMPVNGGEKTIVVTGIAVTTTTTTTTTSTTTTTPKPCDNLIYVLCKQTLKCLKVSNSCEPNLSQSTNEIVLDTCCNLSQQQMLNIAIQYYGKTPIEQFGSLCSSIPTEAFSDCASPDNNGNCQDTINYETLDTIPCFFGSEQPLP